MRFGSKSLTTKKNELKNMFESTPEIELEVVMNKWLELGPIDLDRMEL